MVVTTSHHQMVDTTSHHQMVVTTCHHQMVVTTSHPQMVVAKTCVTQVLHHWPSLSRYFNSHPDLEKEGRVKRVAEHPRNSEMTLYLQFLEFFWHLNEFNTSFQVLV